MKRYSYVHAMNPGLSGQLTSECMRVSTVAANVLDRFAGRSQSAVNLVTGRGLARWMVRRLESHESIVAILLLGGLLMGWAYKCVAMHPEVLAWAR